MSINIRPLSDRVVVERVEEEKCSPGGILIPESSNKEKPVRGTVIAVGTGKLLDNGQVRPVDLKVQDQVLFGKYAGTEVKLDGKEYVVMREEDIMGVIV